jgi:hypothetical protein
MKHHRTLRWVLARGVMVLEPENETDFLDVSHGFRPGRGAHGALDPLWKRKMNMRSDWIVDRDLLFPRESGRRIGSRSALLELAVNRGQ